MELGLLGPKGQPIRSMAQFKKADPPKLGPAFGAWAGRDTVYSQLPGGAVMSFDLRNLTLADYRAMKDNPQINASLAVLTFMMHQIDWHIECENQKIRDFIEENLREVWTRLIRALSQAFWSGYSPCALEWENDVPNGRIVLSKIKDLLPEECTVNWKKVEGYAPPGHIPPKFNIFDGIKQMGYSSPIPIENSLWYPLLMENGDHYGRKLLKPAFSAWYFSTLVHLFANRYYERFGEPLPVGRAPFEADIDDGAGNVVSGKTAMETILLNLRNRSVVTLPSDRDPITKEFDYDIEYLESQMRGADFERYLGRLDEEMSLGIFTPILLFRTADVGSFNLGVQQLQMFLWMLNAIAGDLKEYLDRYVVGRMKDLNFNQNDPRASWEFRKMGKENVETVRALLTELTRNDKIMPDLEELGAIAGLTLKEIKQVEGDEDDDPDAVRTDDRTGRQRGTDDKGPRGVGQPRATAREINNRIKGQVEKAWHEKRFGPGFVPSLGYEKRFTESLKAEGATDERAEEITERFYENMRGWVAEAIEIGASEWAGPSDFMSAFGRALDFQIDLIQEGK